MSKIVQLTMNGKESDMLQDILEEEIVGDDDGVDPIAAEDEASDETIGDQNH